jgi:hypothetical protein
MAMRIRRYGAKLIAQYGRSRATLALDAAIGQEIAPYCPSGRHGHRFRHNKSSCGVVKLLFKASVQKAQNVPSTQLIKATSCVEMSNATIKAEEHS